MSPYADMMLDLEAIARRAGEIAQSVRRGAYELKPDGTIVTEADRSVETYLRPALTTLAPGTTVWGEEYGHSAPGEAGLWLVDPVDGTSNFAYGSPLWGVSIALYAQGALVLGAIHLPDLGELYLAAMGAGATCNGVSLAPIPPGPVRAEELVSYNEHVVRMLGDGVVPGKMRLAGSAVIDGAFVAQQRYRGYVGCREKLYDIAAALVILEELGADVRYADGSPMVLAELIGDKSIGKPWIAFPRDSGFFASRR